MMNRYFVITANGEYNVPLGEAIIWSIFADVSMGPLVFDRMGTPLPVQYLDLMIHRELRNAR